MYNKLYILFTFLLFFKYIYTEISIPANAANGVLNSYLILDGTYSYQDAVAQGLSRSSDGYKGYILTIESKEEMDYIKTSIPVSATSFWLGASKLDTYGNQWGWNNGVMRNQPFYQTFPERCFSYCGNFQGYNSSLTGTPGIIFNPNNDWFVVNSNEPQMVILEFGPDNSAIPIFGYLDYNSQDFEISQFASWRGTFTVSFSFSFGQVPCTQITVLSDTDRKVRCTLVPKPSSYTGKVKITIAITGGSNSNYFYYFNSPYFQSFQQSGPQLSVFGLNFQAISTSTLNIGGVTVNILTDTSNTPNRMTINMITAPSILRPVILSDTNYIYVNRPSFIKNGLLYAYNPIEMLYQDAVTASTQSTLLNSNGYLAYINTEELVTFIKNYFVPSFFRIWTNIQYASGSGFSYYNTSIGGPSEIPIISSGGTTCFFYDLFMNQTIGSALNPALKYPTIVAYGVQKPQIDTSIQVGTVPTIGGVLTLSMLSNNGLPGGKISIKLPTSTSTGTITYDRRLQIVVPAGTGKNIPSTIKVSMDQNINPFNGQFNYAFSYNGPTITDISSTGALPGNLTITGVDLGLSQTTRSVGGFPCVIIDYLLVPQQKIVCQFISLQPKQSKYYINVTVDGQTSNSLEFSPIWIDGFSPSALSLDGGLVEITGNGFVKNYTVPPTIPLPPVYVLVKESNQNCTIVNVSSDKIQCTLPPHSSTLLFSIVVVLGSERVETQRQFSYQEFEITKIDKSGGMVVKLTGSYFSLYHPNWKFSVGAGIPSLVNMIDDENVEITFSSNCTNGFFEIKSKGGFFTYQSNQNWCNTSNIISKFNYFRSKSKHHDHDSIHGLSNVLENIVKP
ncbi:hypothetical protein PPL_04268 [Heterostelium album PN500]|uniref:C-type lectin domain-containing protein n=1 Tax=Heterostelium pallidum (strain ATCC 26659 / Pp 5 / PN500) TaxID=670386 RepID=D3B735_HETP5|nr:hypothetical protein PPL_04268 [Heterostelium album PN500]EFA82578.1 hypothetical protein PPL_04268 [Heterostelium album PN500]|eukprot:XP_020434695.1 hypothetical protein PPL_04268 [Heterostelium album PN500]